MRLDPLDSFHLLVVVTAASVLLTMRLVSLDMLDLSVLLRLHVSNDLLPALVAVLLNDRALVARVLDNRDSLGVTRAIGLDDSPVSLHLTRLTIDPLFNLYRLRTAAPVRLNNNSLRLHLLLLMVLLNMLMNNLMPRNRYWRMVLMLLTVLNSYLLLLHLLLL